MCLEEIGFHITKTFCRHKGASILENIEAAKRQLKCPNLAVAQIFVAQPRGFSFSLHSGDEAKALREYIRASGMNIYAHARYFDVPWSSSTKASTKTFMKREWELCVEAGIKGFVVHLYRYPPERVVSVLKEMNPPKELKIYLETPAINPMDAIYNTPEMLHMLYKTSKTAGLNVGICIDTCHMYASGLNFSEVDTTDEFMRKLTRFIPGKDLLIHLNDSASKLGSGKDHHASLGYGNIWTHSKASLWKLLDYVKKEKIDCILERNEGNGDLHHDFNTIKQYN